MSEDPVRRRTALRLCCTALAAGLAGCGSGTDTPAGEPVEPTASPAAQADGGAGGDPGVGTPTGDPVATDGPGGTGTPGGTDTPQGTDGRTASPTGTAAPTPESVTARRVARGFAAPVSLAIPSPGRRFVVDQPGQIYLQDSTGVRGDPFLDVSDRMVELSGYTERGLLGLAFHPNFADNGRFFVRYSAPSREGTPDDYSHTFVLSEFSADPDATRADPDSERTVMEIPQPQTNHNAGAIAFGPDGYLYVAVGDGGGGGDDDAGHVEDWYDAVEGGNGQDVTENLLGSILRIDVDSQPSGTATPADAGASARNYAVPDDNPLVGREGLDEHYAWGFRNPWRMSFGPDGRLFVGDVGQSAWEEVSVVQAGGNYGWNVMEGTHCYEAEECPDESPDGRPLRDPVVEYPHEGDGPVTGITVIGGYLYDGDAVPGLTGKYVFADWRADGQLFVAREQGDGLWPVSAVDVESGDGFGSNVLSFGRAPNGELFVCTTERTEPTGSTGAVYRLGATD